jgi:Mn-containing catalase
VFFHTKRFQYNAKPDNPDPIFAKQMQELLGGQRGEISVMMTYLFQGWNCRGPAKYRDMFSFLLARDTMHQNQWLAAIEELEKDGLEESPVPSNFPQEREFSEVAYKFMNFSVGQESAQGRWASGPRWAPRWKCSTLRWNRACTRPPSSLCRLAPRKQRPHTMRAGAAIPAL